MDTILEDVRNRIVESLSGNLVCLFLTGSRAKGEEREESDYDLALIVSKADEETLRTLRDVFLDHKGFSVYLLDEDDLRTLPKAMFLQFVHSKKLYGDFDYPLPSAEDVTDYMDIVRRGWLDRIRHYLILPHPREKLASAVLPALKDVYLCLSYLTFTETGTLPKTRKDTIAFLKGEGGNPLHVNLMKTLENWDSKKDKIMEDPLPILLQIEAFFRMLSPCEL